MDSARCLWRTINMDVTMPKLWNCCTPQSQQLLLTLMDALGCKGWKPPPPEKRPVVAMFGKLEHGEQVVKIMTRVPGFDRDDD